MIIHCENVSKSYNASKVLDRISFQMTEQKITGLIGRNGAGKTTLLKMIAGFCHTSSGNLEVFGNDPFNNLTVSANTIFVDDQMAFPETLTLWDLLIEAGRFYQHWDAGLAGRLFEYFQFNKKQFHHHLSKGKKSTFNMIVGLASRSPLTIFDEPTTGMDSAVRKDFYRALLKDYIAHPRSILISSHHLNEIEDLLEDILLIDDGNLVLHTSIDDMREYAIAITGNYSQLGAWINGKEIFHKEKVGINEMYVIMKNDVPTEEIERYGFHISSVSPNDLAVYMTNKTRGGIDDVFDSK